MNKKKFIGDAMLSIAASAIPLVILQLIIFPLIAKHMNQNAYGFFVTMVGVVTVISATFGGALNNTRLILNGEYKNRKESGDFPLLLWASIAIGVVGSAIYGYLNFEKLSLLEVFLFMLIPLINIQTYYYSVDFRIQLKYKRVFFNSVIEVVGYIAGFGMFIITKHWQFVYILGFGSSLLYILLRNSLLQDKWHITVLFRKTTYKVLILVVSVFLSNLLTYVDRFLLYPLIGGEAVSIYFVSTVIGKMIPLAIGPIAGVMLSNFARMSQIGRRTIAQILFFSSAVGILGYFFCIWVNPALLSILYPEIGPLAMKYVYITTITSVVHAVCIVLNPIVLKFHNINWQIAINLINLFIYLVVSLVLFKYYGLTGFCVGGALSMFIRLVIVSTICFFGKQRDEQKASDL